MCRSSLQRVERRGNACLSYGHESRLRQLQAALRQMNLGGTRLLSPLLVNCNATGPVEAT